MLLLNFLGNNQGNAYFSVRRPAAGGSVFPVKALVAVKKPGVAALPADGFVHEIPFPVRFREVFHSQAFSAELGMGPGRPVFRGGGRVIQLSG